MCIRDRPCGLLPGAPVSCHTWLPRSACAGQCLPACQQLLLRLPLSLPADSCINAQIAEGRVGVHNQQHCNAEMQRSACAGQYRPSRLRLLLRRSSISGSRKASVIYCCCVFQAYARRQKAANAVFSRRCLSSRTAVPLMHICT